MKYILINILVKCNFNPNSKFTLQINIYHIHDIKW